MDPVRAVTEESRPAENQIIEPDKVNPGELHNITSPSITDWQDLSPRGGRLSRRNVTMFCQQGN